MLDGYHLDINRQLVNPIGHEHERVRCEVTIGDDITLWNMEQTDSMCYGMETIGVLKGTWSHQIPIEMIS